MLIITKTLYEVLRKRYLVWFRKDYVRRSLSKRKGNCLACGMCCRQSVPFCPFLTKDNKCRFRKWFGWHLKYCKIFPIDIIDQRLLNVQGRCGYYW